ncbi:MAG: MazG family protein, partial [Oscillospiraceae bacterium]|nr:MazG family protein [Oscillospiraceae bacterium]
MDFKFKERYDIGDMLEIMRILRSENGCPWDREQTHKSIRKDFLEEVYEVVEAIDLEDTALLREELGDVLLQVVFHSRIEEEKNSFDFGDVVNEVCQKLVTRHPHVFGNVAAETSEEVLKNWNNIKQETKRQETYSETLESVCTALP